MERYVIALDQGTSSCRALLFNSKAQIIATAQQEFTQHYPHSGWVEHDPMEILHVQMHMLHQVIKKNDIPPEAIASIGITNQRETTVVWEAETGKPIYPAIVWQDTRTSPFCESLKDKGLQDTIRKKTGLIIDSYFSASKIRWILNHVDGARSKAEQGKLRFGTIDTWLLHHMTDGKAHLTDQTNASRTMLYDIHKKAWDEDLLKLFDIPESMLPDVKNSAHRFGSYPIDGVSVPISGVAGDQQAALYGQACIDPGQAKNTYGTGCFLLMNAGNEAVISENGLLTTLCCDAQGKPVYGLEGSIFVAGAAIQWLRDGLKLIKSSADSEDMAFKVKNDEEVFFVPAFSGLGAPYWDMKARGAIFGLTRATGPEHLAKATLDSLAYRTKDVLEAMEKDSGIKLSELKVDGGAVANNYLMQFQADILNTPVLRPTYRETTAMGAAYLAGLAEGLWDLETASAHNPIDQKFTANISPEYRSRLYARWQKAVEKSRHWID